MYHNKIKRYLTIGTIGILLGQCITGFSFSQNSGEIGTGEIIQTQNEGGVEIGGTGMNEPANIVVENKQEIAIIEPTNIDKHFSPDLKVIGSGNLIEPINSGGNTKPLFQIEFVYTNTKLIILQTPNKISKVIKKIDHSLNTYVKQVEGDYYLIGDGELEGWVNSAAVRIITENKSDLSESTGILIIPKRDPIRNYNNFLIPDSVKSFDYQTTDGMTYCSYIARLNLEKITGLTSNEGSISLDPTIISMGDAVSLIEQGKQANIFKQFSFDQTDNLPNEVSKIGGTIFDMYAYHKDMQTDNFIKKFHRFIGFFGDDGILYIIDPVVLHHTQPVKWHEYIKNLKEYQSIIYVYQHGFNPVEGTIVREDGIFMTDTKALRDKKNEKLFTTITDIFDQIGSYTLQKNLFYLTKNSIINIPKNTEIGFLPGAIRSMYQFKISEESLNGKYSIRIGDENVFFTKPVEISIETENNLIDGNFVIAPSHSSSTTTSDGLCLPDGTNTQSIYSQGKIEGGIAKIYICRGGKYSITY